MNQDGLPRFNMTSYADTISAITSECEKIHLTYSSTGDGRITSAIKEKEFLETLEKGLRQNYPSISFHIPADRYWYDVMINNLPINLKLTTGGTDNVFNKVAILYTISGEVVKKRNMNFNAWYSELNSCTKKTARDRMTEYHYLVVEKTSGKFLLKSILDIHTFKTNPCNILQINWANEFLYKEHTTADLDFKQTIQHILKKVQASIQQCIAGMKEFAEADMNALAL